MPSKMLKAGAGAQYTKAEIAAYKRARMKRSVGAAMTAREKALLKKLGGK